MKFTAASCDLSELTSRLVNLFGMTLRKSVRKFLVWQTYVDLRRLASPFGQGSVVKALAFDALNRR